MTSEFALLAGLLFAAAAATVSVVYLRRVVMPRRAIAHGLRILANMRWRELSNLVVEGLAGAGFERESRESSASRGTQAEIALRRDGRLWLLTCKQGLNYEVAPAAVDEFVATMRLQQAAGGVMVTPGRVAPAARQVVANVELMDGNEIWSIVEPFLPQSVRGEVATKARGQIGQATAAAIAASVVAGLGVAWALATLLPAALPNDVQAPAPATTAAVANSGPASRAQPADVPAAAVAAPISEEEQRLQLTRKLSTLPGVERAMWSTRSTLQIFLADASVATDAAICGEVKGFELLRASRLQLQPVGGSDRHVRFIQCATY